MPRNDFSEKAAPPRTDTLRRRREFQDDEVAESEFSTGRFFHLPHPSAVPGARRETKELHHARSMQRLETLQRIDLAINNAVDPREALEVLLELVTEQLQLDAAAILLLDKQERLLRFLSSRGFRSNALEHTRLPVGESWAGQAARDQCVCHVQNVSATPGDFIRSPELVQEEFTNYWAVPLQARGEIIGVIEVFNRSPLETDDEWVAFFQTIATQAAIAVDHAMLLDDLRRKNEELREAYDQTLEGWARALELRDQETEGHCRRVVDMTCRLARAFGLGDDEITHIRRGALLHDIGKMGVPDAILHKPGKLDDDEWVVMRKHTEFAHNLLAPIKFLSRAIDIPYGHHEKWDGSGYPRGLTGEEIPIAARLFAIVDIWDALCHDRPYRKAWTTDRVLDYLRSLAGSHLDPNIVPVFLDLLEQDAIAESFRGALI